MKHLLNKAKLAGGKGAPSSLPARLNPPKLGSHQLASSFSYAEILDLISDGPIEGLVNKNGSVLKGASLMQGIYLDNTPIAVSNDAFISDLSDDTISGGLADNIIAPIVNSLGSDILNSKLGNNITKSPPNYRDLIYIAGNVLNARTTTTTYDTSTVDLNNWSIQSPTSSYTSSTSYSIHKSQVTATNDYYNKLTFGIHYTTQELVKLIIDNCSFDKINNQLAVSEFFNNYLNVLINKEFTGENSETAASHDFEKLLTEKFNNQEYVSTTKKLKPFLLIPASQFTFTGRNDALFIDQDKIKKDILFSVKSSVGFSLGQNIISFVVPNLDAGGKWDGTCFGFWMVFLDDYFKYGPDLASTIYSVLSSHAKSLKNISSFGFKDFSLGSSVAGKQKYNYSNILVEFREGEEFQNPFKYFNKVFIDKDYSSQLLGPFKVGSEIQRINLNSTTITKDFTLNVGQKDQVLDLDENLNAIGEGSEDTRGGQNTDYSNWDAGAISFDESAVPITHIIENPNVESVFISLQLLQLSDTAQIDAGQGSGNGMKIGDKFPTVLNIKVETGTINSRGEEKPFQIKTFQIIALVEQPAIVDIGNPDSAVFEKDSYKYIKDTNASSADNVFTPFVLPNVSKTFIEFDELGKKKIKLSKFADEEIVEKRYIRVTKMSTETNSILVKKDVNLLKVTEIIPVNLSYPFSSIVGLKADSRTFGSIPTRTFDAKLKKIKIPSNYFPTLESNFNRDKRYYNTEAEFDAASEEDKRIYIGDWDGSFKLGWTDNPAWILYDLLTSTRYGLGQYISEDQINKWDLYKIARFCDSVDEEGYFIGVPDGRGGKEPRYSCNILFQEGTKVFDSINIIAALFRGSVFYNNNEINFLDDRLRDPVAVFSNINVKDGIFSYSNYRRDEQFNAIEVVYIDRFDDYKTKIEYIEDEEDIAQRGLFKKQVNALGVTSKAMANRIGKHLIYQTIKENQSVSFVAGLESLLCKPGDLIIVEDELKSLKTNFGKVLDVNSTDKTLRISDSYDSSAYTSGITVYRPTGQQNSEEIEELITGRSRLASFSITGAGAASFFANFTGEYKFSGYVDGYDSILDKQYPVYTGQQAHLPIVYYSTLATGWVFATGAFRQNNTTYDKFITQNTGDMSIYDLNTTQTGVKDYSITSPYRTSTAKSIFGLFENSSGELAEEFIGALDSEIDLTSTPQIITLSITGATNESFGATLYVDENDINADLLQFVPLGSPYRIQKKNSDDQIYKIISIKEENPNEYSLITTKYDTGKFALIENNISIELQNDTFGYGSNHQINDVNYITLNTPNITTLTTGLATTAGKYVSGQWTAIANSTGYHAVLRLPNNTEVEAYTTETGVSFDDQFSLGNYVLAVSALGKSYDSATTRYYDSNYATSGINILDTAGQTTLFDNSFIFDIQIAN